LLRLPGALPAFAAAALLRLSYASVVLSLLLVVQAATGSFAVAGAAVGAYALPSLLAPYKSRLVDRAGVRRTLTCLGLGYAAVLALIGACAVGGVVTAPPYLLLAAASGVLSPPAGPVMRGIWAALSPDEAGRSTAYSLDAVAEEGLFAVGPLLVGAVLLVASPVTALAVTAGLALVGASALGLSRAAAAVSVPVRPALGRSLLGPLLLPGLRWVVVAMLAVGFALAPLEVGVVARATQAGSPAAAGYLLAVLSVGSAAGGLLWGRLRRPPTTGVLLAVMAVLGLGTAFAGLIPSLPGLGVVLALTGAAIAPAFVVAYVLTDRIVDDGVRTEANTWVATAANVGGAAGAAVAGLLIEHFSARASFAVGGGFLIVMLPLLAVTRTRTRTASPPATLTQADSAMPA
jgi:MFS family permease